MSITLRSSLLGLLAALMLVLVPAASGGSPAHLLVSIGINGGLDSGDFVVETLDGTVTTTVALPDGVDPMAGTFFAPATNGSIAFIAIDNPDPSAGDLGSLWLVGSSRPPVHLDSSPWDTDPTISPDGSKIAFARFDPTTWSTDIYVVNSDGSDLKLIAAGEGANDLRIPKFSPDGSSIAYWCSPAARAAPAANFKGCGPMMDGTYRPSGVMLMNADGSDKRMILIGAGDPVEPVGPTELSWSPDGQWLAFDGDQRVCPCGNTYGYLRQIFEYKTDGSDLFNNLDPSRQVTHETETVGASEAQFSPDGTQIIFWRTEAGTWGTPAGYLRPFSINIDGTNEHELQLSPDALNYGQILPPETGGGPAPTVNATHVTVPAVRTLGYHAARSLLVAAHLTPRVAARRFSSRVPRNHVISQRPRAGAYAHRTTQQGPRVKLVLSRGPQHKR